MIPQTTMDMDRSSGKDPNNTTTPRQDQVLGGSRSDGYKHQVAEHDQSPECIAELYKTVDEVRAAECEVKSRSYLEEFDE
jgi:hypothetical protein